MAMATEFQQIYGMRFTGLEDPGNTVKTLYSYPNPEAPYPRDIVIDQNGIVRYWSTEFDPKAIADLVRSLLGIPSSVGTPPERLIPAIRWEPAFPNPSRGPVALRWESVRGGLRLDLYDGSGRWIRSIETPSDPGRHRIDWDGADRDGRPLPAGAYFLRLSDAEGSATARVVRVR